MTDYHTHILPMMDDGSSSCEESIKLLHLLCEQGVDTVYLTPHFYINQNYVEDFLKRRNESFKILSKVLDSNFPKLKLGAEVFYFEGMTTEENIENLKKLKLEDTSFLLLEMPFTKWTSRMIEDIKKLQSQKDLTVLLAHIDRYLNYVSLETLQNLKFLGVMFQMNADYINSGLFNKRAKKLLNTGLIDIISSDTHNLTNRKPNMNLLKKLHR